MILTEVRELLKNRYSNFSESLNLSRFLVGPSGTESIHIHVKPYTECKYGGPLGRRPGRVMKVRLVRPRCFVLTMLPLKSLASWTV